MEVEKLSFGETSQKLVGVQRELKRQDLLGKAAGGDVGIASHGQLGRRELSGRQGERPGETGDKVPGYTQSGPTRPSPSYHHAGSQADATRGLGLGLTKGVSAAPQDSMTPTSMPAPVPVAVPPAGAPRPGAQP